jgi:hypothetical protein
MKRWVLFGVLSWCLVGLLGCGGGGGGSDSASNNNGQVTQPASAVASYEFPEFYQESNYLLVGDQLILFGGQVGNPDFTKAPWGSCGHPAYSQKIYVTNLVSGQKYEHAIESMPCRTGAEGLMASSGIGNSALIKKLDDTRYLIYGGFQYATSAFLLDLTQNTILRFSTADLQYTDNYQYPGSPHQGLNTTPFFADRQGSALGGDGNLYFFGFNNGLYEMPAVMAFDAKQLYFKDVPADGFMPRSLTDAYSLKDGKILIASGSAYVQGNLTVGGAVDGGSNSAARRAEIYDPVSGLFTRVADYPIGKFHGQHSFPGEYVTQDKVCVPLENDSAEKYTYHITTNEWSKGCSPAERPAPQFLNDESGSRLIGKLSNGNKVYMNLYKAEFTATVDGACSCYRLLGKTKVSVVK